MKESGKGGERGKVSVLEKPLKKILSEVVESANLDEKYDSGCKFVFLPTKKFIAKTEKKKNRTNDLSLSN